MTEQPDLDTIPLEWVEGDYEDDYCDCPTCTGQDEYDGLDDGEAAPNKYVEDGEDFGISDGEVMITQDAGMILYPSGSLLPEYFEEEEEELSRGEVQQIILTGELELGALRGLLSREGDAEVTIDNGYEVISLSLVGDTIALSVVGK